MPTASASTASPVSPAPLPLPKAAAAHAPLRAPDYVAITFLGFFLAVAFTFELYWLWFHASLPERASSQFFAHMFQIYNDADSAYFSAVTSFSLCLEGINVYFTQLLNVWLLVAIFKRRPERYPLQLAISAYLSYSLVLYFLHMVVENYSEMNGVSTRTLLLFYGINAPWLVGHLYMAWDAFRVIQRRFVQPA